MTRTSTSPLHLLKPGVAIELCMDSVHDLGTVHVSFVCRFSATDREGVRGGRIIWIEQIASTVTGRKRPQMTFVKLAMALIPWSGWCREPSACTVPGPKSSNIGTQDVSEATHTVCVSASPMPIVHR